MLKEKAKEAERYVPIMICPHCIEAGLQIDPREKIPAYPVIESVCFTHLIIQGDIHPILSRQPAAQ